MLLFILYHRLLIDSLHLCLLSVLCMYLLIAGDLFLVLDFQLLLPFQVFLLQLLRIGLLLHQPLHFLLKLQTDLFFSLTHVKFLFPHYLVILLFHPQLLLLLLLSTFLFEHLPLLLCHHNFCVEIGLRRRSLLFKLFAFSLFFFIHLQSVLFALRLALLLQLLKVLGGHNFLCVHILELCLPSEDFLLLLDSKFLHSLCHSSLLALQV